MRSWPRSGGDRAEAADDLERLPARRRSGGPSAAAQANVSPRAIGSRPKSPSIVPSPAVTIPIENRPSATSSSSTTSSRRRVEEVEHVGVEQAGLPRRRRSRARTRRLLAGPGERRRRRRRRVVDHVERLVPAEAHRRPGVVGAVGLRDHDVVGRLLDLDERDPRPEVVRHAGVGDVDLARRHRRPVERRADGGPIVARAPRRANAVPGRRPVGSRSRHRPARRRRPGVSSRIHASVLP